MKTLALILSILLTTPAFADTLYAPVTNETMEAADIPLRAD